MILSDTFSAVVDEEDWLAKLKVDWDHALFALFWCILLSIRRPTSLTPIWLQTAIVWFSFDLLYKGPFFSPSHS